MLVLFYYLIKIIDINDIGFLKINVLILKVYSYKFYYNINEKKWNELVVP